MNLRNLFLPVLFCILSLSAKVNAQHVYPRHEAYDWCQLSLEDMSGEIRVPVVFVNFSQDNGDNEQKVSSMNQMNWMTRLNDSNPMNHMGADGSLNDYFTAQSYGRCNVVFEQIGTYTASGKAADYASYSKDAKLVQDIVQSVSAQTDWTRYDCNADHLVDCLLFIYAGHSDGDYTSRGTTVTSIYPHQGWIRTSQNNFYEADGYRFDRFVFCQNLRDGYASIAATHTACHELSHGIFDLCDYYSGLVSYMGQYDAMCYGFNQTGYSSMNNHCCDMCSFNRMLCGWLTPMESSQPCHVVLRPLSQAPDAFIIYDPRDGSHFYMLENRATTSNSWDAHLPAGGLVLTDIHWRKMQFQYHTVNAGSPINVRLVNASTSQGLAVPNATYLDFDQRHIPYGIEGRTEIPSAVNELFAAQTVTNITIGTDGTIEFDYMGGGETLAVEHIYSHPASKNSGLKFDLTGRCVPSPFGGIYIKNGKKIYIKN